MIPALFQRVKLSDAVVVAGDLIPKKVVYVKLKDTSRGLSLFYP